MPGSAEDLNKAKMKRTVRITFVLFFSFLPSNWTGPIQPESRAAAQIQEVDDSYQRREDQYDLRKEGFKNIKSRDVNSDGIAILSVKAITDTRDLEPLPDVLHLGIFLRKTSTAEVSISHGLYQVDSLREEWGPGFDVFTWPTGIIRRNEIPAIELHTRAVYFKKLKRRVFPASIYADKVPEDVQGYEFIVAPLRNMRIKYWILDGITEKTVLTGAAHNVVKDHPLPIPWDCRNDQGKLVAEGEYILKLRGSFRNKLGRTKKLPISYQFYHRTNLSE